MNGQQAIRQAGKLIDGQTNRQTYIQSSRKKDRQIIDRMSDIALTQLQNCIRVMPKKTENHLNEKEIQEKEA